MNTTPPPTPPVSKLKLGKQPPRYDPRTLSFAAYRTEAPIQLPPHPSHFGHFNKIKDSDSSLDGWGMLGNDQYGCCVFAGAAHEHMMWDRAADQDQDFLFLPEDVLSDYAAVTGFSLENPQSTDNGTNMLDAMNYRRKVGIRARPIATNAAAPATEDPSASFTRRQICAYLALEAGDTQQLLEAMYLFGAVGIGFQVPAYAMDQFSQRVPWSVTPAHILISHGQPGEIIGGHYVPLVGYSRSQLIAVSWGRVQRMTKSFYKRYCDEAYAFVSEDLLNTDTGLSPEGFDFAALSKDLEAL